MKFVMKKTDFQWSTSPGYHRPSHKRIGWKVSSTIGSFYTMLSITKIIFRSILPIGKLEYPVCMPQAPSAATDEFVSAKFSGVVSTEVRIICSAETTLVHCFTLRQSLFINYKNNFCCLILYCYSIQYIAITAATVHMITDVSDINV